MPHTLSALVARTARAVAPGPPATDGELLRRFAASRDEVAFGELVRRLGPLVLGACRRVTGDAHLADDAFQAAFLVLLRRAGSVRPAEAVRGYLYGVAVRCAREARKVSARRRLRETPVSRLPDRAALVPEPPDADALRALDEAVAALPEHLRAAVVLCELDGLSRRDAAGRLGVAEGTLSSRLAKARKLLAGRLRARGFAPPAVGLAALADAAVPPRLLAQTSAFAAPGAALPPAVITLTMGAFRDMLFTKLKSVSLIALGAALLGGVALALAQPPASVPVSTPVRAVAPVPRDASKPFPKGPNRLIFWRDGKLVTIGPDGKGAQEFVVPKDEVDSMGGLRLSPDGKRVALRVSSPAPPEGPQFTPATLVVRDLDDKGPGTELGANPYSFAWSPDGGRIAYTEYDRWAQRVKDAHFIVNVATKDVKALKPPERYWHHIIDWTRDGKHLVTLGAEAQFKPLRLHFVPIEDERATELTDGRPPVNNGGRISPDGRQVLTDGMTILDLATKKAAPVSGVEPKANITGFCWSPDGKRIAYLWLRHVDRVIPVGQFDTIETERNLTVCDPDGKNAKTIVTEKGGLGPLLRAREIDWR